MFRQSRELVLYYVGSAVFAPFYIIYHSYRIYKTLLLSYRFKRTGDTIVQVPYSPTRNALYIDVQDKGITTEIATLGVKEPQNTKTIQRILSSAKLQTIVDLGANIGDFVLLENQASPTTPILAVEPVTRNMDVLKKNVNELVLQDLVTIEHAAVATDDALATIRIPEQGNWSSLRRSEYTRNAKEEQVSGIRFESLWKKHSLPNDGVFMRMDIEGYEHDLLSAHHDFLAQLTNSYISLEFHVQIMSRDESVDLLRVFESTGFKIKHITNDAPYWVSFFHTNMLYPLLIWGYKHRIGSRHIEATEDDVSFEELERRFLRGEYIYAPHITFYKE